MERQNIEDVIRILYEIEKRLADRHDRCCKEITEAIQKLSAADQAGFGTLATVLGVMATAQAQGFAQLLAAIQALQPPEEATALSLEYSLGSAQKRFR